MLKDIADKLKYKDFPYVEIKTTLGSFVLQPSYFKGFTYEVDNHKISIISNEIYNSLSSDIDTVSEIIINNHVYDINVLLLSSEYDKVIELEHGMQFRFYKNCSSGECSVCISYTLNHLVDLDRESNYSLSVSEVEEITQDLLSMNQYTGEIEHWKNNCDHPLLYDLTLCYVPKFTEIKPYTTVLNDVVSIEYKGKTYSSLHTDSIGEFALAVSNNRTLNLNGINTIVVLKTSELKKFNINMYLPHLIATIYTLDFQSGNLQCYEAINFYDLIQQYKHLIHGCKHFEFGFMSLVHADELKEDEVYLVITGTNIENLSFSNKIHRGEIKL